MAKRVSAEQVIHSIVDDSDESDIEYYDDSDVSENSFDIDGEMRAVMMTAMELVQVLL